MTSWKQCISMACISCLRGVWRSNWLRMMAMKFTMIEKRAKAVVKTGINKSKAKAQKAITASIDKAYNRRDLQSKVQAKYARLRASMKTKKVVGHKSRSPKKEA